MVTAQFREQNLQQTPISITAVTGDMLQARSITNIVDVADATPNVIMREGSNGNGKANQAFIRGLGQGDFLFSYSPRVSFYIDEVYHSTVQGTVFELLDIDRIEVLRGPQGTLFGRNAVGGAFRIFTKKPMGDNSGNIALTYGDYDHYEVKGTMDVPVVADKLFLRVSGGYIHKDGYVDRYNWACLNPTLAGNLSIGAGVGNNGDCKVGTLGGTEVFTGRIGVRWLVSDRIENTFRFEYSDDRSEAPADTLTAPVNFTALNPTTGAPRAEYGTVPNGVASWLSGIGASYYGLVDSPALRASLYPNDPYKSYAIYGNPGLWQRTGAPDDPGSAMIDPAVSNLKTYGISNILDINLSDNLLLKSITGYRKYDGDFGSSQASMPWPIQEVYNTVGHHQFTEEVQLTGNLLDGKLEYTVGGFYLDAKDHNGGRVTFEGFAISIPIVVDGAFAGAFSLPYQQDFLIDDPATLKNESAFAHLEYHVTDRLNVTGGIRYSHEKKTYTFYRHYYYNTFAATPDAYAGLNVDDFYSEATESKWTPKISVDYQLTDDAMVYASFATGFTAGGINGRPFNIATDTFSFGTENVYSYEAGFKTEWLDRRLRLNGAVYYTQFKNMQLTVAGCPTAPEGCRTSSPFYVDNAGNSRMIGFELEMQASPVDGWLVTAGLGYNNFKYTYLDPQVNPPSVIYDGMPNPQGVTIDSPLFGQPELTANIGTQYDINMGAAGILTPRFDLTYRSAAYFSPQKGNPYTTQDAYALANARVTWQPDGGEWNLSFAVTNLFDKTYYTSKSDGRTGFGTALGTVAPPREWQVSIRRNF